MRTRTKILGASLAACLLTSGSAVADPARTVVIQQTPAGFAQSADEPRQITIVNPSAQTTDETYTTWNSSLFIGGAVLFGASYGAAVVGASQSDREADDRLYVPLLGPWLDLADRGECDVEASCDSETTKKVLIVADGILQAGGAFMMLDALLFPTVHRSSTTTTALKHVKPIRVGDGGRGLAVSGKF